MRVIYFLSTLAGCRKRVKKRRSGALHLECSPRGEGGGYLSERWVYAGGGGDSNIKTTGCSSYLLGVKKAVLIPQLGCSASKELQRELLQYLLGDRAETI